MKKTTLFLGRGSIAVGCLDILNQKGELPACIICDTHDRGQDTWAKSLLKRARELGYRDGENLFCERKVNKPEFLELITQKFPKIDIIFSIQPFAIFRMPFISLAKDYVVNLHFAPLPKLRGVAPCSWAIADDLSHMGVTLHCIEDEGIDNGPIIAQKLFPITQNDTAWTLFGKCITHGKELFKETLADILSEDIDPKKQNESESTYHPMKEFDFDTQQIPTSMTVKEALRFARSRIFPPLQLPYFLDNEKKISILSIKQSKKRITQTELTNMTYYLPLADGVVKIPEWIELEQ